MSSIEEIMKIGALFNLDCNFTIDTKEVLRAIQLWFYSLPKYTKICADQYIGNGRFVPLDSHTVKFKNILRAPEIEAENFFDVKLPEIFGESEAGSLYEHISKVKIKLNNTKNDLYESMAKDIQKIFAASEKLTPYKTIKLWAEGIPARARNHYYENGAEVLFNIINQCTEGSFIDNLSKNLVGVLPDNFEPNTPQIIIETLTIYKKSIELFDNANVDSSELCTIQLKGQTVGTFKPTERIGDNGTILFNELKAVLDDYSGAVPINERRQVLFNLLISIGKHENKGIHV